MARRHYYLSGAALLTAVAIAVAGCSSSGGSGSPGSPGGATSTGSATSTSDTGQKATGSPIDIGMINEENTPIGSFTEARLGAQAAVSYLNNEAGGVNGRPIHLITCITDATPATSRTCANEMVSDKVTAVVAGVDLGTSGSLPILAKAGIPYVGGEALQLPELTSPLAFAFSGGSPGAFAAQATYVATKVKPQKVSVIYPSDNAAGTAGATAYVEDVLKKLGVPKVQMVGAPAATSDFTSAVEQANSSSPQAIMVVFPAAACSRIMRATQSLGVTAKMFYPGACASADVTSAGGAGANGAYFTFDTLLYSDTANADVATYRAAMQRYQDKAGFSNLSENGFQTIMNLAALLKKLPGGSVTSHALITALKATSDEPSFLGHPYTCSTTQKPYVSLCDANERIAQWDGTSYKDVLNDWISGIRYAG